MAAADSLKVVENRNFRRYHAGPTPGHIHKGLAFNSKLGHSVVAANASIPTKYQTIVTDNADKKGFQAKSKRFKVDAFITEAPPPGAYAHIASVDKLSPSYSKKGTGSFASKRHIPCLDKTQMVCSRMSLQYLKSKRQGRFTSSATPGPGAHELPSLLRTRKDFNRCQVERLFQMPIAVPKDNIYRNDVPAPNSYETNKYKSGKVNNVTANAAFKSNTKRELIDLTEHRRAPAPGQYEMNDNVLHQSVKVPYSSFKSTSKRQMQPEPMAVPGPGAYDPNAPVDQPAKLIFPRKHYLCISAPAMPLPDTPPAPGPGAYEVRNFEDVPKHYMSSSAFVSTTGRWASSNTVPADAPGPAHYRPIGGGKQSFIFNSSRKWL